VQMEGDSIRCLWSTPDGSLWIGYAHTGIGLLKAGHYALISTKEGMFENGVSQILADDLGNLWIAGTSVFRVREQELQDVATGRANRVRSVVYGRGEELANVQANFLYFPGAARTHDGLLWFPMRKGLLSVHTKNIGEDQKPLPVVLEQVIVDGRTAAQARQRIPEQDVVDLGNANVDITLPPEYHKLEFRFTALSYIAPDQIIFRYRLEGVDENWVDSGGQRSANYSRLQAGKYKFRVAACNQAGIWSESPVAVMVLVEPFFWQTWWFRLASILCFAGLVGLIVRFWSVRLMRRRLEVLMQQQAMERERARIARDLHDDLGASLTQIAFIMEELCEEVLLAETLKKRFVLLGNRVNMLARDLDAVVWTVNPRNDSLTKLVAYLSQIFLETFRPTQVRTRLEVADELLPLPFSPDARHHLFLVAKEIMNNVMKHAEATEVRLKMTVLNDVFELTVEDNGVGFSLEAAAASKRHGLRNMATRIEEIGGEIKISSALKKGTLVVIRVPLVNNSKL
jgi:signal transduction histidine kinase